MLTLINPPGLKSFSGLQMHVPNPPLGLAYIAAAVREAGFDCHVVDGTGEALDDIHSYPGRADFLMQGLKLEDIVARIPRASEIIGITCMFSTLWPLTRKLAELVREAFPDALLILGGEHGTAVHDHVLRTSPFDVIVLGEGEQTIVDILQTVAEGKSVASVSGVAYRDGAETVSNGLSARARDVDAIPRPAWDLFPLENYISRHQVNGVNIGRSMTRSLNRRWISIRPRHRHMRTRFRPGDCSS